MSETNSSPISGQRTYLSNRALSYIDIVSLLAREKSLQKFSGIMATTQLKNILETIAFALENVLDFKPQLEVMMSLDRKVIFREDYHYYLAGDQYRPFDPFAEFPEEDTDTDVLCVERPNVRYSLRHLKLIQRQAGYDFTYIPNPQLFQLMADSLTVSLNEDQLWVKQFREPRAHFLQKYVSLEKTVRTMAPELAEDLTALNNDMHDERMSFMHGITGQAVYLETSKVMEVAKLDLSTEGALALYDKIHAEKYESVLVQDFWDRPAMRQALREFTVMLTRAINNIFPTARQLAEQSLCPAYGYDVFQAEVVADREIVVKKLGDYRVLYWELQRAPERELEVRLALD